jgi:hypothetical protein
MKQTAMKRFASALTTCVFFWVNGVTHAVPGDGIYAKPGRLVPASDGAQLNCLLHG